MKRILTLILAAAAVTALSPSGAAPKITLPACKGRVVWTIPGKMYVLNNNPRYGKRPGSYACEATAKVRGYHMRPLQTMRPIMHGTPLPTPSRGWR